MRKFLTLLQLILLLCSCSIDFAKYERERQSRISKYPKLNNFFTSLKWKKFYYDMYSKPSYPEHFKPEEMCKVIESEMTTLKEILFDFLDIIEPFTKKVVRGLKQGQKPDSDLVIYFREKYRVEPILVKKEANLFIYIAPFKSDEKYVRLLNSISDIVRDNKSKEEIINEYKAIITSFMLQLRYKFRENIADKFEKAGYGSLRECAIEIFAHIEKTYLKKYIEVEY